MERIRDRRINKTSPNIIAPLPHQLILLFLFSSVLFLIIILFSHFQKGNKALETEMMARGYLMLFGNSTGSTESYIMPSSCDAVDLVYFFNNCGFSRADKPTSAHRLILVKLPKCAICVLCLVVSSPHQTSSPLLATTSERISCWRTEASVCGHTVAGFGLTSSPATPLPSPNLNLPLPG